MWPQKDFGCGQVPSCPGDNAPETCIIQFKNIQSNFLSRQLPKLNISKEADRKDPLGSIKTICGDPFIERALMGSTVQAPNRSDVFLRDVSVIPASSLAKNTSPELSSMVLNVRSFGILPLRRG